MLAYLTSEDIPMLESVRMLAHQRVLRNQSKLERDDLAALWQGYVDRLGELLDTLRTMSDRGGSDAPEQTVSNLAAFHCPECKRHAAHVHR